MRFFPGGGGGRGHLKVLLADPRVDCGRQAIGAGWHAHGRVLVHVLKEQCLTNSWLVVDARAPISVPTCSVRTQINSQPLRRIVEAKSETSVRMQLIQNSRMRVLGKRRVNVKNSNAFCHAR